MKSGRVERLRLRLLERGEVVPIVLPPWALESTSAECTTLVVLAPVPTQLVLHLHPWPGSPSQIGSGAGALALTRCGRDRVSLLGVAIEMRSPRAVVHSLVATSPEPPLSLPSILPEREPGAAAAPGEPGPPPAREPLGARLRRFEEGARGAGATGVDVSLLSSPAYVRLVLAPGCHRLLASGVDGAPPFVLLLGAVDSDKPERLLPNEAGDVTHEICTAREQRFLVSIETAPIEAERQLAVAHFPAPRGLPERFGPELGERLLSALGGSQAPRELGPLVAVSLGAQGRTPLPRALLPRTCYLAAAIPVHGVVQALSIGARAGATSAEATSLEDAAGPHLGFCTSRSGQVELDVEARGAGLAWLFALFQLGPAEMGRR